MKVRIPVLLMILLSFAAPFERAAAQDGGSKSLRLHTKAEDLYRSGHFERAFFIYTNELATIGDKYAQYMAGYMCLHGQGMKEDPVEASAWYRLAAERGAPEFVHVRDRLLESMSEEDRIRSDERFIGLRFEYGDVALALEHLRDERRRIAGNVTGSLLGESVGPVSILDPDTGTTVMREQYVKRIHDRMQVRLDFITRRMGIERVDADMTNREFDAFADEVDAYLRTTDDRRPATRR